MSSFNSSTRSFDTSVITQLDALLLVQNYPDGYDYLSETLLEIDPGTNEPYIRADPEIHKSQLFFEGASNANEDVGAFSSWIRAYTNEQGTLRYGNEFTSNEMQAASDAVADSILNGVADTTILPDIEDIANFDALEIRNELFPDLTNNDNNPAWSGVVLYLAFDSPQLYRLNEGVSTTTFKNWWYAGVSTAVASHVALGELGADPSEFCTEDQATIDGLRDLWQSLSGLSASDLLDPGAVTPISFDGTPITFEQAFDNLVEDFVEVAGRFKIAVGQTLTGAAGDVAETLCGADADEIIQGNGGSDLVFAGAGRDTTEAGDGDDVATGGLGHDDVLGGAGNDVLYGGTSVEEDDGADYIEGGDGDDMLFGGSGADWLFGGDPADSGPGNDTVDGGPGNDVLEDGDTYVFREGSGHDVILDNGDQIVFEGISSSDVSLVWEFEEETGDDYFSWYGDYIQREGPAALQIDATGDSILVSDDTIWYEYVYSSITGYVYWERNSSFGAELVFDDQTISTDEEFFALFELDSISSSTIPASFMSAPDDFEAARDCRHIRR